MLRVLFAEYGVFRWYAPVDAEAIVKNADAAVRFGMVELVALVLEHGRLAQYGKTVGETFRNEELPVVVLCQLYGHVLSVCRRAFAYVNGNVQHFSSYASNQFGLSERRTLEMQTTHHAV